MTKAVIFDCFGVLTEDGWKAFSNKYVTAENSEEIRYINHQADIGAVSYKVFLDTVCQLTGASHEEAHTVITAVHHPNIAVFELMKQLKDLGYKLGVISNVGSELNNFLPQEFVDLFDETTLSYRVGVTKPQPEIYESHLRQLGIEAKEAIFIDDREVNCEGARMVGLAAILYENYEQLLQQLQKLEVKIGT